MLRRGLAMKTNNELNWWIDLTGSTHTHQRSTGKEADPATLAAGKVYLDSKSGVITHLKGQPANIAMVSQELLDVLHVRFPGTRWWVKDLNAADVPARQAAS